MTIIPHRDAFFRLPDCRHFPKLCVKYALFSVLALSLLFARASVRAQAVRDSTGFDAGRGPVSIRNMRPYNLLFLQFTPESGDTLPARANRYDLQLDIANNLLNPAQTHGLQVLEDNEVQRLEFSWRHGTGHGGEIGVFVPIIWRNGGFLDPILSGYHSLFGLPGNADDDPSGRDSHRKYQSILQIIDANGKVLVDKGNAFGPGEVSVTWKQPLIRPSRRSSLAWRAGVKLPTGNPTLLLGSGAFDAGISLDARYSIGRDFNLYVNYGGILTGRTGRVPHSERGLWQGLLGVEYHPNHRDRFIAQVDGGNPTVRTGNEFADRANVTATFGYKRVLDRTTVLSLSFSENGDIHNYTLPALSNIGPDFTVHFGLEWQR